MSFPSATNAVSAAARREKIFICLGLALLIWAIFGQTIHFDFVNFDDPSYVYRHPAITQGDDWSAIWWIFTHANCGAWFPITDLSHRLAWNVFGANPGGHHLINVLLHAATAIFLFLTLAKLTGAAWRAAFVAALFAVHPLRAESVAWVVERKDVLSGLFFVLTIGAWARYIEQRGQLPGQTDTEKPPCPPWRSSGYLLALVFFALGLLAKSMIVTLPGVLLLLDFWPLKRFTLGEGLFSRRQLKIATGLFVEKIPFIAMSLAISIITLVTQKNAVIRADNWSIPWRMANAAQGYVDYVWHFLNPVGLTVVYAPAEMQPTPLRAGISIFILLAATAAIVLTGRKFPYLFVGWFWYLGMMLPAIDIMQAGENIRADRYTYLPQIGLAVMLAWSTGEFAVSRNRRRILATVGVALIALLSFLAHKQTGYWRDSVTLWTRCLQCNSNNAFAWNTLGSARVNQQLWAEAEQHFRRALKIRADYPEAAVNLGVTLINQNQRAEAIQHFRHALEINPHSPEAHYNLGDALSNEGKLDEAIQHLELAVQARPFYREAEYALGFVLARQGKWEAAIPRYERAMNFKLNAAEARYITGVALATHSQWPEAAGLFTEAIALKSDFAEAHYRLGIALAQTGEITNAESHFQTALDLAAAQNNAALGQEIRAAAAKHSHPPAK